MTQPIQELAQRVDRLDRQNKRLRFALGGLGATGLAGFLALPLLMSAGPAPVCKTIWGERIVLKDSYGKDRMVLDAYSSQTPSLTLKDAKGKSLAALNVGKKGDISLQMYKDGKPSSARFLLSPEDGQQREKRTRSGEHDAVGQ